MTALHRHRALPARATGSAPRRQDARWGFETAFVPRHGIAHHRLIVLAPGSTRSDHRLMRLHQEAPALATIAALPLLLLLAPALGALGALLVVLGVACAAAGLAARAARGPRRTAVRIDTCVGLEAHPLPSRAARTAQLHAAARLTSARQELRAGRITPVAFEQVWQEVYEEVLPFDRRRARSGRRPEGSRLSGR